MFQRILNAYANGFQRWVPTPLTIAILLTAMAGLLALQFAKPTDILNSWVEGMWNANLIRFGFQAMFMLVLGHVLALAPPVLRVLNGTVSWIVRNPHWAASKVAFIAMMLGWFNWGLGLVGGAILVRGVMDYVMRQGKRDAIHFGVLGAAGYAGLLVWHGGLSGSAPLKAAESGHLRNLTKGADWTSALPDSIGLLETVFSGWSMVITGSVIIAITLLFAWLGKVVLGTETILVPAPSEERNNQKSPNQSHKGFAERLDTGRWLSFLLGIVCIGGAIWWMFNSGNWRELTFITPDWINMVLLGAAFITHHSVRGFLHALDQAIQGGSGILIQFPLYFGIMGVVTGTGLGAWIAEGLVQSTSLHSLSIALFTSSGLLNIFVPSGGGQWAVQGPLVLESCHALGLDYSKGIMAMAYGDQLTNMLQPFWALPLLGITGLKARDILPFTLMMMVVAGVIMAVGMLLWV